MDQETAEYIFTYHYNLLSNKEKLANKHISSVIKLNLNEASNVSNASTKIYREVGWLTDDEDALSLVKLGEEGFRLKVAMRILSEFPCKVMLNYCEKCKKLARTPTAKQCRHCGYDWH